MRLRKQFSFTKAVEQLSLPLFIRWINQRLKDIQDAIPVLNRDIYPELPGETHVVDMSYPPLDFRRYGCVLDGVTNDTAGARACFAYADYSGGVPYGSPGLLLLVADAPFAGVGTVTIAGGAGAATFSTSQAGIVVNGWTIKIGATSYFVTGFNGTTGCTLNVVNTDVYGVVTLTPAPNTAASAFTIEPAEIIRTTTPVSVSCSGLHTFKFYVDGSVPNTVDVIRYTNPNGIFADGLTLEKFSIIAKSGCPARNNIRFDCYDGQFSYAKIDHLGLGPLGSYAFQTIGGTVTRGEFYAFTIENCQIGGGANFEAAGDSIRMRENLIYSNLSSPNQLGIRINQIHSPTTAHGFSLTDNNITCAGGAWLLSADGAVIERNDWEAPYVSSNVDRAMINLSGLPGKQLIGVSVNESFLGAGATTLGVPNVDICLRIGNAVKTRICHNMVGSAAAPALMYHNTVDARSTTFVADWNVSDVLLESYLMDEGKGTDIEWIGPGELYFMQPKYFSHKSSRANMSAFEAGHEQFADQPMWGVYGNDPNAPAVALVSVAGALDVGAYRYRVAYVITGVEQAAGSVSGIAYITTPGTIGQISVSSIPISSDAGCTARVIYRSKHDQLVYYVHHTIADNVTTSFVDNTNDSGLGTQYSMLDGSGILKPTAGTSFGLTAGKGAIRAMGNKHIIVGDGGDAGTNLTVWGPSYMDGTLSLGGALNLLADVTLIVKDSAGTSVVGLHANTTNDRYQIGFVSPVAGIGSFDMHEDGNMGARLTTGGLQLQSGYGIAIGAGTNIAKHLRNTKTWDPGNVTSGGVPATTTITITGAVLGDEVTCGFSNSLQGLQLSGYVSLADTVTVVLSNLTGGAVDLASGTLSASVWQH